MAERKGKILNILCTDVFKIQLKAILNEFAKEDYAAAKNFKMYLDTIIINVPTKAQKFKKSIYFDNEDIKDITHQGFVIPFFIDKELDNYIILGIIKQ
jgi:hypothetical protein